MCMAEICLAVSMAAIGFETSKSLAVSLSSLTSFSAVEKSLTSIALVSWLVFCTKARALRLSSRSRVRTSGMYSPIMKVSASRFEALCEFVLLKQKLESLNAFAHVAQDFIARANRCVPIVGGSPLVLAKQVLGILSHSQLAVAVRKNAAIKSRADQGVLETSLKESAGRSGTETRS